VAAGLVVQRRRLPHLRGTPRAAACGVLGSGGVVLVHMLPGVLGVLSRWSVLLAALVLLAVAVWRLPPLRGEPADGGGEEAEAPAGAVSWVLAGGAAGAVALWLLASAWNRTVLPPEGIDTLSFHFPVVGRWIQEGTFWRVDQFAPLLANGNYPHTGDVVFLAAILPWRNDWLAGAVNPVFVVLAAVAVYAIARELRAPRPAAMLGAALFASLPVVGFAANGEGMTDSFMFACFGAGILFLLRHELGAPRSELWLAGLALGLAFGTKWYSAWAVPAVVAVWLGVRLVRRIRRERGGAAGPSPGGRPRATLRDGALVSGLIAAVGGFWLVRNLAESGNPLQPLDVRVLGVTLWDAPRDFIRECAGFTIAHYAGDWDAWTEHILPVYRDGYAGPGIGLGLGLLAAAALAAVPRATPLTGVRSPSPVRAGVVLAVLLAVGYALTPYSAFGPEGEPNTTGASIRYLVPALLVAAPLAAYAIGRAGRLRLPLEALAAAAVVHGIEKAFDVPLRVVALVLLASVAVSGAAWLALHATSRLPPRPSRAARAAAALLAAAALAVVGQARQREFNDGRYEDAGEPVAAVVAHAPEGSRIGLAGVWGIDLVAPVWPAFGERLRNEVEYVGRTVDGQLREYDDRASWAAAIGRGGFDLLLVGREGYGEECPVPGQGSDDDAWARAEGFQPLARDENLTLYRVKRPG
jgi:hypothetical protein